MIIQKENVIPNSVRNPLIKNEEIPKQIQHNRDNKELYDEDGYSIASLEEALAEEQTGLGRSFSSRDEMIKTLLWEIDNGI